MVFMSQCSTVVIVIQCSTVAHEEKATAERESAGHPAQKEKGALRLPHSVYPVFWVWVFLGVISMSYHSTTIVRSSFSDLRDER